MAGVSLATLTGTTSIIENANKVIKEYNESLAREEKIVNEIEKLFETYLGEGTEP